MRNKATGVSRGFGFVSFRTGEQAQAILSRPHHIDGRQIDIKPVGGVGIV